MLYFDRIVVGAGGIGSSTCLHLANAGAKVLAVDRFPAAHDRGSSHGETRIIRRAYFEHPHYVPLLNQAYGLWDQLQRDTGLALIDYTGLLEVGPESGVLIPGVLRSAELHGLSIERPGKEQVARRFPGFMLPADYAVVFEPDAGVLHVERCVRAHLDLAIQRGIEYLPGVEVTGIEYRGDDHVVVETSEGSFAAGGVVLCSGAWADSLLPRQLGVKVLRKHMNWFRCRDTCYAAENNAPVFFFELPEGCFYGFPSYDGERVKVAEHTGGEIIDDPLNVSRDADSVDRSRVAAFTRMHLPGVDAAECVDHQVCLYTMSPDEHFVVDRDSEFPQLCYAAGLSGHGFKFATILGKVLASMSLGHSPPIDTTFLSASRLNSDGSALP